ncbi:TauD/TfdA family dioxygenase [Aquimarina sediminis]|uniref:TauD/TfdA family dioxygenase n=1 Tax=Aquimarina sediminis TaxID=2070536 RepID=UPI000CA06284|nr:TauD/TfdA family dioxygenase [Aquimarina sediminis]
METSIKSKPNDIFQFGKSIVTKLPSKAFPFTITPEKEIDVLQWAEKYKDQLNNILLEHGAILLRGFKIEGPQKFNELFSVISGEAIEYSNRTSPREQVYNNVYTSTSHPSDQTIYMHTENSYSNVFNRVIAFYCLVPPLEGGETPIADERRLLASLTEETVAKFKEKGIQYVRNTIPGIGLDWRTIYQTNDRSKVNEILDANGHDYTWIDEDHLRIKWSLPAFQTHPVTGEKVWFNHMYFGHKSLYNPSILEYFEEEDLPFVTYYGDGQEIEQNVIDEFKTFYDKNSIVFKWEKDDFLLLDNMFFSHGRRPFEGDRTILTTMSQPYQMKV